MNFTKILFLCLLCSSSFVGIAQNTKNNPSSNHGNYFEQLGTILPTPNVYRTASGAPGHLYWQQKVDYKIVCELDEDQKHLKGKETITYHNNSPDALTYFWIQLDENEHSTTKNAGFDESTAFSSKVSTEEFGKFISGDKGEQYGFNILTVRDMQGNSLTYTINKTMMRVELPKPLSPQSSFTFEIAWNYYITDRIAMWGRGGYEHFQKDGNQIFTMSQWYPRLCVYSDFHGWQNHQFTGRGEFALTFGDFDVTLTVPKDHAVAATGECTNYEEVLTQDQLSRLQNAKNTKEPIEIITLEEAKAREKKKQKETSTWHFVARNVRDFAWTSSRKFIWDAMYTEVDEKKEKVLCMSLYPKEAYALYRKYSTKVVAHTIRSYSHFTIPYPYPVAQSIEAESGMEYPMICFNHGRTEEDGTYSDVVKYGMISVIIHEVGHNFFPMIVNSDERQWSWFDEGLNTFVQYLTEQLFQNDYPSKRGPAHMIVPYMKLPAEQLEPIMVNSENIRYFGANAYAKPATALNILRETVMGRDLFDYAFKEYARRWEFKHPEPADFFRTMEDASAVDLDWFWRGWFYDITPVDISLDSVQVWTLDPHEKDLTKEQDTIRIRSTKPYFPIASRRNKEDQSIRFAVDQDPKLVDFYNSYRPWETKDSSLEIVRYRKDREKSMSDDEQKKEANGKYIYDLYFTNKGGLVSPIVIGWTYEDGTTEKQIIDAQIWRKNEKNVIKTIIKVKPVKSIVLDPERETADIDETNQSWPIGSAKSKESRFKLYKKVEKEHLPKEKNPMQKYKK